MKVLQLTELPHEMTDLQLTELPHDMKFLQLTELPHKMTDLQLTELPHDMTDLQLTELPHDTTDLQLTELQHDMTDLQLTELQDDMTDLQLTELQDDMTYFNLKESLNEITSNELAEPISPTGIDEQTDTLAMARKARKDQGSFEVEISYRGEFDLHRHMTDCTKNPGHHNFIPVLRFTNDDLPPRYRKDDDLVECIRALAALTVRIRCKVTSSDRPDTYPDSEKPYPFSSFKGNTKMLRCGTGWILHVNKKPQPRNKSCTPKSEYAEIEIRTAAHHIYDQSEGEYATCDLFYDEGLLPGPETIQLTSGRKARVEGDFEGDMCDLTYVTHDLDLADRLEKLVSQYETLHTNVKKKYQPMVTNDQNSHAKIPNNLVVIVSHPHGCSKHVSVGEYVDMNTMDCRESLTQYIYNTPTCCGSSGAPVFILDRGWLWLFCDHPHSGNIEGNNNLNYSGFALN